MSDKHRVLGEEGTACFSGIAGIMGAVERAVGEKPRTGEYFGSSQCDQRGAIMENGYRGIRSVVFLMLVCALWPMLGTCNSSNPKQEPFNTSAAQKTEHSKGPLSDFKNVVVFRAYVDTAFSVGVRTAMQGAWVTEGEPPESIGQIIQQGLCPLGLGFSFSDASGCRLVSQRSSKVVMYDSASHVISTFGLTEPGPWHETNLRRPGESVTVLLPAGGPSILSDGDIARYESKEEQRAVVLAFVLETMFSLCGVFWDKHSPDERQYLMDVLGTELGFDDLRDPITKQRLVVTFSPQNVKHGGFLAELKSDERFPTMVKVTAHNAEGKPLEGSDRWGEIWD